MNVIELSIVAKMLRPAAHHGTRWPPRKKSLVDRLRRVNEAPRATIAAR
jgi:hypothetical protein